ncbi:MAG: hypothetical protein E3J87_01365 [Candidatus Cloacimonadota bacterium]|nr:MAG: hypothetical protein E3J87_01365 [Candidatus Cloacimonadota bacterium]
MKNEQPSIGRFTSLQNNEGIGWKDGCAGGDFNIVRFSSIRNNEGAGGDWVWRGSFNAYPPIHL